MKLVRESTPVCEKHNFELIWRMDDILSFRCRRCATSCASSRSNLHAALLGMPLEYPLRFPQFSNAPRAGGYIKKNRFKEAS